MTLLSNSQILAVLLPHLQVVKGPDHRGEYVCWCPFHPDGEGKSPHKPNLQVSERGFICFACGAKGGLRELANRLQVELPTNLAVMEAHYNYCDEHGNLLFQVVRKPGKQFRQRRPDGKGGWIWDLKGVKRVLYRLPEILRRSDELVLVVEGEKDADRLLREGLLATTNPGGAGKWRDEYSQTLSRRDVGVIPDNDDPGQNHADQVARSLHGMARTIKVVELPGLPEKGDVSDWLHNGGSAEQLKSLAASAPVWSSNATVGSESKPRTADNPTTPGASAKDPSQVGVAHVLLDRYGDDLHWDARRRQWVEWDDRRWSVVCDERKRHLILGAVEFQRQMAATESDLSEAARRALFAWSLRASRARVLDEIADTATFLLLDPSEEGWDEVPHLLGVGDGQLVDLRTGQARSRERADRILLSTHVPFDPEATASRFDQFLQETLEPEIRSYLQRAVGYSLTGEMGEQVWFLLHGRGANGKSTLLNALLAALGEYGVSVRMEIFAELRRGGRTPDLGALDGPRMVMCSEIDDGAVIRESRIKALTGGDLCAYLPLYKSTSITFRPRCKPWFAVNHLPITRDTSPAYWRRVRVIPFATSFEGKPDKGLPEKLRTEAPGILAWAILGAADYYRDGLPTPETVRKVTGDYRDDSDPLGDFLAQRAITSPDAHSTRQELWRAYVNWSQHEKIPESSRLGIKRFGQLLGERFERDRLPGGVRVFRGIGLEKL